MTTTYKWTGAIDSDPDNGNNWSTTTSPSGQTDAYIIFDATSDGGNNCDFSLFGTLTQSFEGIKIAHDFTKALSTGSQTITLTASGLEIQITECWSPSDTTIAFTGAAPFSEYDSDGTTGDLGYYVKFDSTNHTALDTTESGVFINQERRVACTFNITPQPTAKLGFMDGVYPILTMSNPSSSTATISPTHFFNTHTASTDLRSNTTSYPKVDCLALTIPSAVSISPNTLSFNDMEKIFKFDGALSIACEVFNWGYSTVEFVAAASEVAFPCNGATWYGGADNQFNSSFHKVIIGESSSGYGFVLGDTHILTCNDLVVNGSIYATASYGSLQSAEIHTVKRPTVNGDWNFQQVADGIYRARGTKQKLGVPYGGTGNEYVASASLLYGDGHNALSKLAIGSEGQVLTVNSSSLPEWGEGSTGSGCGLIDIGSLLNDQDVSIHMGNLICS